MGVMKRFIERKLDRISRNPERDAEKQFKKWCSGEKKEIKKAVGDTI